MSANLWYYVDRQQQRQGPVDAEIIREAYRGGQINGDSLVWREGMGAWAALRQFELEFDLEDEPASFAIPPQAALRDDVGVAAPVTSTASSPYAPPAANLVARQALPVDEGPVVYAGFWKRYAAMFIDGLIFTVAQIVLIALLIGIGGVGMSAISDSSAMGVGFVVAFIVLVYVAPIVIHGLYSTLMQAGEGQATLGKRAVGIKVVSRGERMSFARSLGRWAAYTFLALFSCGLIPIVSAFMVGLGDRKQSLHDMMADTTVVDRWAYTEFPERQRDEVGTVAIVTIVVSALLVLGYFAFIAIASTMRY